jgi:hypothetical protein
MNLDERDYEATCRVLTVLQRLRLISEDAGLLACWETWLLVLNSLDARGAMEGESDTF